jgi:hypothetical protein
VIANRPFNNVSQFWRYVSADLGMTEDEASRRWPDAVFNIKTEYFQLYIEVLLGDVRIEVKSVINRPSNGKPVIISRDITTVPASLPKNSASKMQTLASPTDNESDKDAENSTDNTDMQPACLMIEAY